ncbi:hypothetical protein RclHR1_17460005 [Rhizophagus clarus]|uniref:Uncharacterized protein n=1 Tax=Rhizophagus clarus TaxID=94130 RepID=A0A2Z6RD89_9GLOM|nr:hypothetical protein RclHR1_17460005 [Rhizophagus clarus]GES75513.1 hypothetical protein GLOIN_2v1623639 [Rhizophagus clarus]
MVVNDTSEVAAVNGVQHEASVLLTPTLSSQPLKKDCVDKTSDSEEPITTPPLQNGFCKIHDTLELKNIRKSGIPHSLDLDLPPTPTLSTFLTSSYCDNNSPTSSPCFSSYFDIYQPLNSCSSNSSSESNSSNSNSIIDSPDTPPLSPPGSPESPRSPLSPKSIDSVFSTPLVPSLSNIEQRRTTRQVSFNQTVTYIPHIPPPPNKIRKKLTKEAGARHKDLVLEVEDLGKVRLDGKNGRVIKIVPNVFPGPLNGEYGQCDVMLKDVTKMEISSKNPNDNTEEEDDDDVLYITAVPIVEKDKKLRLGKHFKRYYNKLIQ